MTEEYWSEFADYAEFAAQREDHLESEARRLQTLRNLAMSKAAKARKKKKKQRSSEGKLTDAERREIEKARIRDERQERGKRSAQNRSEAAKGKAQQADPPQPKKPEPDREPRRKAPDFTQEPEIDIALPPEKPKTEKDQISANKKTKQKSSKRASAAGRYGAAASARQGRISSGGAVTVGILTGLLIGTVIYGRVQTNEVYTEIAKLQSEYDDLVARKISMKSEMEGELTVKNIKDYAEGTLGLKPLTQSQIEYIALQTEDEVEISEPEDNFFVTVNDYLVGIWEFLRGQ
ncbi:MAG: hypothetical protein IKQ91_02590 [Oscillospiraceae bacterium]|nr:hypothetical protein [Oscillospiraceae bacterium]